MSGPNGERCADCYFGELWNEDEPDPYFCRRYPPNDFQDNPREAPFAPTVSEDSWCGEYRPKT